MGNPQNLYLFSYYGFSALEFFALTAKIALPSLFILAVIIIFLTRRKLADHGGMKEPHELSGNVLQTQVVRLKADFRTALYFADFVICLLTVFHVVNYLIMLGFTIVVMAVCNWRLFKKVDYSLLLTFVGFFIFTKSLSKVPAFTDFINSLLSSPLKTYLTGIAASQIISNVPAALLLSGFTQNGAMLLLAVNVGGLGTLIASMASVISFKLYTAENHDKYFAVFTVYNIVLLIILGIIVYI
jgi:Na+/H+ antiporter NhaD/arsenite permease-like protein